MKTAKEIRSAIQLVLEKDFDQHWEKFDSFISRLFSFDLISRSVSELHRKFANGLIWFQFLENFASIAFLLAITIVTISYLLSVQRSKKIKKNDSVGSFVSSGSSLSVEIIKKIEVNVGSYKVPWWYSADLGTIFAFGVDKELKYERELFSTADADFAVDWFPNKPSAAQHNVKGIIVFLPGLGLSSKNKFCKQFVQQMSNSNFVTAVVNARGMGVPLKTAKFWHPGLYGDAQLVLEIISNQYPNSKRFVVGFSAGSNITQKLLLESKKASELVHGAFCVCVNQDYFAARERLEKTVHGRVYSYLMSSLQKEMILQNRQVHHEMVPGTIEMISKIKSLSEFDAAVHSRVYGFASAADYNDALSTRNFDSLSVPLFLLQPADDPLHQGNVRQNVDVSIYQKNNNIIYFEPHHGNHFGFFEGDLVDAMTNTTSYTYPAKVATEFFDAILEKLSGPPCPKGLN